MPDSDLKGRMQEEMKDAMRARDRQRLAALRLILAEVQQYEVDQRRTADDSIILGILDKMIRQRRESTKLYEDAGRDDLADRERFEITVIESYMPEPLDDSEIEGLIDAAIGEAGASSIREMGQVMGILRPKVQGRADMSAVSARVKARLAGN